MTTLVVSDMHLDRGHAAITEHFLAFLAGEARSAAALYVLGDLFEAWLGDDDDSDYARAVESAFADLSASGVALYFLHGNRDFLLGPAFCARTGGRLIEDPTIIETGGVRALLTHGDALCIDDVPYQKLRALVRNPRLQRRFRALPLGVRRTLAGEAREGSQSHTSRQAMALMDVNEGAVRDTFARSGVNLLIHGHTHRPGTHALEVDGRAVTRIVLGDWYREGSCVRIEGGTAELVRLPRG